MVTVVNRWLFRIHEMNAGYGRNKKNEGSRLGSGKFNWSF